MPKPLQLRTILSSLPPFPECGLAWGCEHRLAADHPVISAITRHARLRLLKLLKRHHPNDRRHVRTKGRPPRFEAVDSCDAVRPAADELDQLEHLLGRCACVARGVHVTLQVGR